MRSVNQLECNFNFITRFMFTLGRLEQLSEFSPNLILRPQSFLYLSIIASALLFHPILIKL